MYTISEAVICIQLNDFIPKVGGWQDFLTRMVMIELLLTNYARNCLSLTSRAISLDNTEENTKEEWLMPLRKVYFRNECADIHRIQALIYAASFVLYHNRQVRPSKNILMKWHKSYLEVYHLSDNSVPTVKFFMKSGIRLFFDTPSGKSKFH
jgi:hypothetical protein